MVSQFYNLRLPYGSPDRSRDNDDFVLLEQEPWDPYVGWLTKMGVYAYLNALLFDGGELPPNCAYAGGLFSCPIYAYPSRPNLNYIAGCSWGTLGERRVQELSYTEAIQCNLEQELTLKYPALEIVRYIWVGDAYSPEGEILVKPAVTIVDNRPKLAAKVYGTLLVTYKVCRHTYSLRITPRQGALENKLQSFVIAVWDGGNTYIEVEAPEGAEEDECNNFGSGGDHFTSGDDHPEEVPPEDEHQEIDYCTQVLEP